MLKYLLVAFLFLTTPAMAQAVPDYIGSTQYQKCTTKAKNDFEKLTSCGLDEVNLINKVSEALRVKIYAELNDNNDAQPSFRDVRVLMERSAALLKYETETKCEVFYHIDMSALGKLSEVSCLLDHHLAYYRHLTLIGQYFGIKS